MAETQRDMTSGRSGAPGPTSAVGMLLRQARERSGQSLASAAQQLRIRDSYLRAIEEGDFRLLPGATYAVGFLRSYADHLGLDPQEIVRRFREEVEELGRRTQLVFPAAPAEGKIPGGAILLIAAVVALVGYGGWYILSERDGSIADLVPAVPSGLQNLFGGDSESTTAPTVAEGAPAPAASPSAPEPSAVAPTTDLNSAVAEAVAASASSPSGAEAAVPAPETATTVAPESTAAGTASGEAPASEPGAPTSELAAAESSPSPVLGTSDETADTVPETPSEVMETAPAASPVPDEGTEATAPAADAAAPPPEPEAAAPTNDAAVGTAVASGNDGIPAAPEPPSATEDLPEGQQYGVTNADARVVLIATQEAWVQIKKASGEEVWTKVLRPGDRFMVPNERGLILATGNAGGLQVVVDGRPVAALGPIGVVRRGILLDPQRLIDGTAAP
jgi:cytoskeleton protein RodZ